jgi:hypothetical protein
VVAVGLTVGFELVEVNPLGEEVHEYVLPVIADAPILADPPLQIVLSPPALAVGSGLTVIITASFFVHPVDVLVTVNE